MIARLKDIPENYRNVNYLQLTKNNIAVTRSQSMTALKSTLIISQPEGFI